MPFFQFVERHLTMAFYSKRLKSCQWLGASLSNWSFLSPMPHVVSKRVSIASKQSLASLSHCWPREKCNTSLPCKKCHWNMARTKLKLRMNSSAFVFRSSHGFMHMRIQRDSTSEKFILGQFSKPFPSVPEMVNHYSMNRLPIRGAEHMCLLRPVCEQLLWGRHTNAQSKSTPTT